MRTGKVEKAELCLELSYEQLKILAIYLSMVSSSCFHIIFQACSLENEAIEYSEMRLVLFKLN